MRVSPTDGGGSTTIGCALALAHGVTGDANKPGFT